MKAKTLVINIKFKTLIIIMRSPNKRKPLFVSTQINTKSFQRREILQPRSIVGHKQ